ncbi:MAG: FAD:protein FMN transferase [Candidatus Schekmanbacteria bacterium]|nr:FAD:protein FMN transferase [Candidatus Schekmanbacteria bacterium]
MSAHVNHTLQISSGHAAATVWVRLALVALVLIIIDPFARADNPPVRLLRKLVVMGTECSVAVVAVDRGRALAASEAAVEALRAAEDRLTSWRADSELMRLNRSPVGVDVALSEPLSVELAAAWRCREATGGAFEPAIGMLTELWDLRGAGARPDPRALAKASLSSRQGAFVLRAARTARRVVDGAALDAGGFGKGAGLDRALEALHAAPGVSGAALDLGGQLAYFGAAHPTEAFIANPRSRDRVVAVVAVPEESGSVSTSGAGPRSRRIGGEPLTQVIDPETGSAVREYGSVTVWAPSALMADCLSTGLYALGADEAARWGRRHPEFGVAVIEINGGQLRLTPTGRFERTTSLLSPGEGKP